MGHPAVIAAARAAIPLALAAMLAACATGPAGGRAYLDAFVTAERGAMPFAPVTDPAPKTSLAQAYVLQRRLIARRIARGDRAVGYRGSLMSAASLKSRGVTEPLAGALFASGRVEHGSPVSLCGYRKASVELKIGFRFTRAVTAPPASGADLAGAVGQVMPVVDLPDIAYLNPDRYSAVDMVASNISAARYVVGAARRPDGIDLDGIRVALTRNGTPVTAGFGRESFGDQWNSLAMVVRQVLAYGRRIAAGDMVVTGKIGERAWLTPGQYRADYGPFGVVDFPVLTCGG